MERVFDIEYLPDDDIVFGKSRLGRASASIAETDAIHGDVEKALITSLEAAGLFALASIFCIDVFAPNSVAAAEKPRC